MKVFQIDIDGKPITIETGLMAKQANGSVIVRQGDTMVLVTACMSSQAREGIDFMPLSVEYREKAYAAGMIPGSFYRREGRPSEKEILSSRLIDRPIRPLFPDGFHHEVQIFASVISFDQDYDGDVLGIIGGSAALAISDIPFEYPIAGMRIGKIGSRYVFNPTVSEREESVMDIIIAGNEDDIAMVEGHTQEVSEDDLIGAFEFAKERLAKITVLQKEMVKELGKAKFDYTPPAINETLIEKVTDLSEAKLQEVFENTSLNKLERNKAFDNIKSFVKEELEEEFEEELGSIGSIIDSIKKKIMRHRILEMDTRIDGRHPDQIRNITCQVGLLPRTHGSALFTRGETQSLAISTLGTKLDEQMIENLEGESYKSFMLHYNFPPFSVGETGFVRGPGRREIGHGHLAEESISPIIPNDENFPYTIRIVSDILESNGSSSMASVCAGSLSLMDAGVPIKEPVAGIANGLIKEGDRFVILSDISGEEDHYGDMDFKITGTTEGITAFQMDIKIPGISLEIMKVAMEKSKKGREHILGIMKETISAPRTTISKYAPRIETIFIPREKIGELIGPGGKNIRALQEETGTKISVEDDGKVCIASVTSDGVDEAVRRVQLISAEPELNQIYKGKVKSIVAFGAFVEILPGNDGLLHISEIDHKRVNKVEDVLKLGDTVEVKLIGIENGKLRLSRKALIPKK